MQIKNHIANAIALSFAENMKKKAPDLISRLKKGEIKSLEIFTIHENGKNLMKCKAEDIEFTFPIKPIFIQNIENKFKTVFKENRDSRREEQNK